MKLFIFIFPALSNAQGEIFTKKVLVSVFEIRCYHLSAISLSLKVSALPSMYENENHFSWYRLDYSVSDSGSEKMFLNGLKLIYFTFKSPIYVG